MTTQTTTHQRPRAGRRAALAVALLAATPSLASAQTSPGPDDDTLSIPTFRLSLRGQFGFVENEDWQAVGEDRMMGGGEIGLDAQVGEHLSLGVAYAGRALNGRTYGALEGTLGGQAVRVQAGWRWHPSRVVTLYGRAGVGAWFWDLEWTRDDGETAVRSERFRPGFFGGVCADVYFVGPGGPESGDFAQRFALGANVELTYDRFLPLEFSRDGRSLGTVDLSGPGFLVGFVAQF